MKNFLAVLSLIFVMFIFVSCVEDEDDLDDFTDTESGSTESDTDDHSNQEDTQEENSSDTDSDTDQDPDQSDTTDSGNDPNNGQGGDDTNPGDNTNPGTNPGDNTNPGTDPGNNTDPGTTVEEEEEDDYDYDKCIEITLGEKMEYTFDYIIQGGTVYRTSYEPRTGSDPEKEDHLNFEFFNLKYLTGVYIYKVTDPIGQNYSNCFNDGSKSGLFLVVYEDGGAKNYIQRKGKVRVTAPTPNSSSISAQLTDVFLEEVTIDKSTHETTVVPDGACIKINDTTISV